MIKDTKVTWPYWSYWCTFEKQESGEWQLRMGRFWVFLLPWMSHKKFIKTLAKEDVALLEQYLSRQYKGRWYVWIFALGVLVSPGKHTIGRELSDIEMMRRIFAGVSFILFLVVFYLDISRYFSPLIKQVRGDL